MSKYSDKRQRHLETGTVGYITESEDMAATTVPTGDLAGNLSASIDFLEGVRAELEQEIGRAGMCEAAAKRGIERSMWNGHAGRVQAVVNKVEVAIQRLREDMAHEVADE